MLVGHDESLKSSASFPTPPDPQNNCRIIVFDQDVNYNVFMHVAVHLLYSFFACIFHKKDT